MSTPQLRNDQPVLTGKDELVVSGAAMSHVPWAAAGSAGAVVAGADLVLHVIGGHIGLGSVSSSLSAGTVALFAVAGAGALARKRAGRAARWARENPWRFAILPGAATAVVVFALSVLLGSSGVIGGVFTSVWHGAIAYGVTGLTGAIVGSPRRSRRTG